MSCRYLAVFLLAVSAAMPVGAQPTPSLATPTGFELGLQGSGYRYTEPDVEVRIDGQQLGGRGAYTVGLGRAVFGRIDIRGAYGELDYSGSGTAERQPNVIAEARIVVGRDHFVVPGLVLTPYLGMGYRYLYSDLRGQSSTGAIGYRRYSRYLYLPIGLTARIAAEEQWVVSTTIEYDHFIRGRQDSYLSDTGLGLADAENTQKKGVGYRGSLMFEKGSLSLGPWLHVWRIEDSDIVRVSPTFFGLEPENETRELGVEVNYRF